MRGYQAPFYRHSTSFQHRLMHTDPPMNPQKTEHGPFPPNSGQNFSIRVAASKEEAKELERRSRLDDLAVYSDASGRGGQVGAAAVLYCKGRPKKQLRFRLGPITEYAVHEGELVGLLLALHLLKGVQSPKRVVTIYVDSLPTVLSMISERTQEAQYLIDEIRARIGQLQKDEAKRITGQATSKHNPLSLTIAWVPSHSGIPGNKDADTRAKQAAKGQLSKDSELPRLLRSPLWKSKLQSGKSTKKVGL